jgi:competence protein ComEC
VNPSIGTWRAILAERAPRVAATGPPLLAFALGVGLTQTLAVLPSPDAFFPAAAVALLLLAAALRQRRSAPGLLLSVLFGVLLGLGLGLGYGVWRAELRLADGLPLEWERRDIALEGIVAELPREFERGSRFVFRVEKVLTGGAVVPERIMLSWYVAPRQAAEPDEEISSAAPVRLGPGERWRLTVRLKRPHGHANPGGFDYEAWLLERGIRATGYVRAAPRPERLAQPAASRPGESIEAWRAAIRDHLQKNLPAAAYAGVVVALAIGDQGSIPAEHWQIFGATGTSHLMSMWCA